MVFDITLPFALFDFEKVIFRINVFDMEFNNFAQTLFAETRNP